MHLKTEKSFTAGSRLVVVSLLLSEGLHRRWTSHLKNTGLHYCVHLRLLLENEAISTAGSQHFCHDRARARYQPAAAGYVRHNVKVNWHIWAALQTLARGLGLSTCHLVALLIEKDLTSPVGDPTMRAVLEFNTIHRLTMRITLELGRPFMRRKLEYRRMPRDRRMAQFLATRGGRWQPQ